MRRLYLFVIFFVLFEFTAYAANDMIMPGMLQVVEHFKAPLSYVALSLGFYILGSCALVLIVGLLAERYGKRKIMVTGNFCFLLFTILIIYSQSINQFMFWRLLEGSGLAIIGLGYAIIHENFDDKRAVKLISLMANVGLLAPLAAPAIGSLIVISLNWQYIFIITAAMSAITVVGLYKLTPESVVTKAHIDVASIAKQYWHIIKSQKFLQGVISATLASMPILLWISQAPNLIIYKLQQDFTHYTIYQVVSISGMALSSIAMQFLAGKHRMYTLVKAGSLLILAGLALGLLGAKNINFIVAGQFIYTLGLGLANGCIMRLIMSNKAFPQGMVASLFGFIETLLLVLGISITNKIFAYYDFSLLSFTVCSFGFGILAYAVINIYIKAYRDRAWE